MHAPMYYVSFLYFGSPYLLLYFLCFPIVLYKLYILLLSPLSLPQLASPADM